MKPRPLRADLMTCPVCRQQASSSNLGGTMVQLSGPTGPSAETTQKEAMLPNPHEREPSARAPALGHCSGRSGQGPRSLQLTSLPPCAWTSPGSKSLR